MGLSKEQIQEVENVLKNGLRNKFKSYNPEPAAMPFHTRLLGKDRLALFSFIQSLNTNFGTSIFEPVALVLAKTKFKKAKSHEIADEFWDFLGGKGTYQDLLDSFERVGIELRPEIDKYFEKFKR